MGFFSKPTIEEIQKDCDHSIIPYIVDTEHFRKGTASIRCICEKCAKKFPPGFYDPSEDDPAFNHIITFTKEMDRVLKQQGLKIAWPDE